MTVLLVCLGAYLLGSFPTSIVLTRLFRGIDVRRHGSGNAGATNVLRVAGWKLALPVAVVDVAKGFVPALLAQRAFGPESLVPLLAGAAAVAGHVFPVWAGFRGGKGVGTSAGAFLALHPAAVGLAVFPFALAVALTRMVSLGSIAASLAFPLLVLVVEGPAWAQAHRAAFLLLIPWSVALVLFHFQNILRMLEGRENRF